MVEEIKETKEKSNENFAEMLDASLKKSEKLNKGDVVEGEIVSISPSNIFITLGGKNDAAADTFEYQDKEGNLAYKVGDTLKGFVVNITDSEIRICKSLTRKHADTSAVKDAFEQKIPVQGKVTGEIKGGFSVNVLGARSFCPFSQMDLWISNDKSTYIGNSFDFEISEYSNNGRNIIVTRRRLLQKERDEQQKAALETLEAGTIVKGKISRLADFGAFVDLGGIDGLIHVSEISWSRIKKPSDVLEAGQEVTVKILKIEGNKISLSLRETEANPFDVAIKELNEGDVVKARVIKLMKFGAFVEIATGVEGLIPISELARGRFVSRASEIVNVNDMVEAQIIKIDPEKRKISLSLKSLQSDPWDDINEYINEHDTKKGVIENVEEFGAFIKIIDGITGLIPASKLRRAHLEFSNENVGQEIDVKIMTIDSSKKRISLEPAGVKLDAEEERPKTFRRNGRKEDTSWKKYAKEKATFGDEDNPFSKL